MYKKVIFFFLLIVTADFVFAEKNSEQKVDDYLCPEDCDKFYGKKNRLYLHGPWKFKTNKGNPGYDFSDEGSRIKYWTENYDDSKWETVILPRKIKVSKNPRSKVFKYVPEEGVGYYRKSVLIPERKDEGRAILTFRKIAFEPVIWINGKEVARPQNLFPGKISDNHSIDITDALKWGKENVICVRFFIRKGRAYDKDNTNGIFEPCWIEFVPPVYCSKILIAPKLPDKIKVKCEIVNTFPSSRELSLKAEVFPWLEKGTKSVLDLSERKLVPGANSLGFEMTIKNPVLWSLKNPFLYSLKLFDKDKLIGWERFGLREFTVRNQYFYLNGKKVFLFGVSPECTMFVTLQRVNPGFYYNKDGFLRKYLKELKRRNINTVFRIERIPPRAFLDICDEIGMFNIPTPDVLNFEATQNQVSEKVKEMMKNDKEGYLREALRRNLEDAFNHPSVVAYSPEGECNRVPGIVSCVHRYKKIMDEIDNTRLFSGTHNNFLAAKNDTGEYVPLIPPPPYDYMHGASLCGSITGLWPHTVIPYWVKWNAKERNSLWVGERKPSIYTEALYYYGYRTHAKGKHKITSRYGKVMKDGKLNKKLYCELYSQPVPQAWTNFHYVDVKWAGVRNSLDYKKLYPELAEWLREMIELTRMNDEYVQGFGSCFDMMPNVDYAITPNLDPALLEDDVFARTMRKVCSPVFICSDLLMKHNLFAGREYPTKIFCYNYSEEKLNDVKIHMEFLDKSGKSLKKDEISIGALSLGERRDVTFQNLIPQDIKTGNYRFELKLCSDKKILSENDYQLFILSRADYRRQIKTDKKVGVICNPDHWNFGPDRLLAFNGVKSNIIDDYDKLSEFDVIFIAKNYAGRINGKNKEKLKEYLCNGGRVVCLEQEKTIPWLEGTQIKCVGTHPRNGGRLKRDMSVDSEIGTSADLIEKEHPVFNGIRRQQNWRIWNAPLGRIYTHLVYPLFEGVILAGADNSYAGDGNSQDKWTKIGMVIAEVKVDKGIILLSQVEAPEVYGVDSVATKYLQNLFRYALSNDWNDKYARHLPAEEKTQEK